MPNQYHYFYGQNETLLYEEHIQDLLTIDRMWVNKQEYQRKKEESAKKAKEKNPFKKAGDSGGFYGHTFKYK